MDILISFCNTSEVPGFPNLGLLNVASGELNILKLPKEIPATGITGLTISSQYIFLGLQHSDGGINASQSPPGLLVFDRDNFKLLSWYRLQLVKDVHSMLLMRDEKTLLIVSTGTDDIIELVLNGSNVISEKVFLHLGNGERHDNLHVNSICEWQNEIYVSGFGPKEEGGDWSSARNGFVMNLVKGDIIVEGLEHPHSLTVIDGKLTFCESRKKALRIVGREYTNTFPGYTRGLCADRNKMYVGTSKHRKKSKSTGKKVNTGDQQSLGCTLSIVSKNDLSIEKTIDLNNYAFEIYDLLPVERNESWPVIQPENYREAYEQSWYHRAETVIETIQNTIPKNEVLLLVDENMLQIKNNILPEHTWYPFLERDGVSWGPPENEETALNELRRMIDEKGAGYIVFAWPAFWWFYVYPGFTRHLREGKVMIENEDVVVYELQGKSKE